MPQTIKLHSNNADVGTWQHFLNLQGADPQLEVDNAFGPATDKATKAWQKKNGLTADGIVGPKSWLKAGPMPQTAVKAGKVAAAEQTKAKETATAEVAAKAIATKTAPAPMTPIAVPSSNPVVRAAQAVRDHTATAVTAVKTHTQGMSTFSKAMIGSGIFFGSLIGIGALTSKKR